MFTHTRSGRGRICHFLRTMMVWSARFRSGRGKLGVGPISCRADFAPAPPLLRDRACVNTCNDLCWNQFPPASARARPRMCERTLRHYKLLDHDLIGSKVIKLCPENLATNLSKIYNWGIENGKYPNHLKIANVIALYKKRLKNDPNNYRPYSLLFHFAEIFENILCRRLISFFRAE